MIQGTIDCDMSDIQPRAHERAAEEFAQRATDALDEAISELIVYGSVVRGETRGRDSDVDVFVVLNDGDKEEQLREIAYDVTLDYGVVVSVQVRTRDQFEERKDHPFIKNVLNEGYSYG